jgi:hypothetical protein
MLHAMAAVFFADFLFGGIKRKSGGCRAQRLRSCFLLGSEVRSCLAEPELLFVHLRGFRKTQLFIQPDAVKQAFFF